MKKKLTLVATSVLLVAALVIGGTLAYFTDTDSAENVFTLGNVKIALHEGAYKNVQKNGAPINTDGSVDTSKANPNAQKGGNFGYDYLDDTYQSWLGDQTLVPGTQSYNRIQKRVFVENTGSYDAYVRVYVGIPTALDNQSDASKNILHWNQVTGDVNNKLGNWKQSNNGDNFAFTQDGYNYYVYYYTQVLKAGDATNAEAISYFYLDEGVDTYTDESGSTVYTHNGEKIGFDFSEGIKIPVYAEAIQAEGFDSYTAAFAAYGDPAFKTPATSPAE